MQAISIRPSTWTMKRKIIAGLFLLVVLADIDVNGSCGCDDFAPRVSAVRSINGAL